MIIRVLVGRSEKSRELVREAAIESGAWNNAKRRSPVKEHMWLPDAKTDKGRALL